jgi:hypothetical protein
MQVVTKEVVGAIVCMLLHSKLAFTFPYFASAENQVALK